MANELNQEKKTLSVSMLAEGNSIRSIERMTGIHRDTVMRLGVRVGEACAKIQNDKMRGLQCANIEVDEIWGFIGAKRKNAARAGVFGDGRTEYCMNVKDAAARGEIIIYTSAITCVECVWIKGHPNKLSPDHEGKITAFFEHNYIRMIQCTRLLSEQARALIWKYPHLKPKDAIHVASALKIQVHVMHSYDNDDLVKLDGKIGDPALKICNPGDGDGLDLPKQSILPLSVPPPRPSRPN